MKYLTGFGRRVCFGLKTPQCAAIVLAAVSAGCSADVTRFDSASFNLNDPPESARPVPSEPVRTAGEYGNPVAQSTPRGPYGAGAKAVEVAALPDATPSQGVVRPYTEQSWKKSPEAPLPGAAAAPAYQASPAAPAVAGAGETVEVKPGDTLYAISKRHHVSLAELMAANSMTTPNLKPGQKLVIPAAGAHSAKPAAVAAAPHTSAPTVPMTAPSADLLAKYNGSYTVQPGDSIYKIARTHKVNFSELQNVNGISDPRKVKPGVVLKVPAGSGSAVAAAPSVAEPAPAPLAPTSKQPTVINANQKVAALTDKSSDATATETKPATTAAPAPAATQPAPKADKVATAEKQATAQAGDTTKLRWPVSGRVIAGFGGRPDGTHNDGINLSVPLGTDVHAAEGGVVAYAGSELKGYGNLVLLRHDNGWVTAYAHNDELLVKRGDKVKRGQVIGKAGKTGTVDQPQVHFELRQGSKPVDPTPFMEKI